MNATQRQEELIRKQGYAGFIYRDRTGDRYRWCAEIVLDGKLYRKRSVDRTVCEDFLRAKTHGTEFVNRTFYKGWQPRVPKEIQGWVNTRELRKIIAESNPNASDDYRTQCLMVSIRRGTRDIRVKKVDGFLYFNRDDLVRELDKRHLRKGQGQTAKPGNKDNHLYHDYADKAPDDGNRWMKLAEIAEELGIPKTTLLSMALHNSVPSLIINDEIHAPLEVVRDKLMWRMSSWLTRCGYDKKKYPVTRRKVINGRTFIYHYCPDLVKQ